MLSQVVTTSPTSEALGKFSSSMYCSSMQLLSQAASVAILKEVLQISTDLDNDQGFLAFLRLVGSAYFKKHLSAFKHSTPESLYSSIEASSIVTQHKEWMEVIRKTVWEKTVEEKFFVPSNEALELHWKRCKWVLQYWSSATNQDITMPALSDYGWYREDGALKVQWDTNENITRVEEHIAFLTTGCRCKTGCTTRRCKCKKGDQQCGPSCKCIN